MGHRQKIEANVKKDKLEFDITSPGFTKKDLILLPPNMATSATYLLNIIRSGLRVDKKRGFPVLVEPFR